MPISRESAFDLFVHGFAEWWPLQSHHIGERPAVTAVVEPNAGGRWYERDEAGNECEWGRVLAVERPERILIAWRLTPEWKFDPDPAKQTEVEVVFAAEGEGSTRVTLEHRGFEVHGEAGGPMRESVGSDQGWPGLLDLYARKAAG